MQNSPKSSKFFTSNLKEFRGYFHKQLLYTNALNHIKKHPDLFPPIKLDRTLDRAQIEQYPASRKTCYLRDNDGYPALPLLSMFKAILLGQ